MRRKEKEEGCRIEVGEGRRKKKDVALKWEKEG